jgi:hypothetical protein
MAPVPGDHLAPEGPSPGRPAGRNAGELPRYPPVHVVPADLPGHGGQGGAADGGGQPECVLNALGQALDVERIARDGLAKFRGGPGELGP